MKNVKIISGKKTKRGKYKHCFIEETVGKTVEAVGTGTVEGAYGDEPCTVLFFSDGTCHSFVHPTD